jgi:glycosyltransferase involved in cell wall biosynthesis
MPERPRILLLVTLAETGGAQAYVIALVVALLQDYDITVAAHGEGPVVEAATRAGVRFVPLRHVRRPISPWRDTLGLLELIALMRRVRPHVVHASSSKTGVLGRLAAWLTRVPIRVFTVHGWAFSAASGRSAVLYRWADRLARPLTTTTICVSEREREAGIAAGTCDARTTVVIRNGIDVRGRPLARPETEPARIVSVGRLQAPKDPLTLVRALAELEGRAFHASFVGDGPERREVESEIARLGLSDAVELAGRRPDVPEILAASQVFVLASRSEGFPMAVLEAMAAGLPVVASRVGGLDEIVDTGETGLLVRPGDPSELARAIARLLDEPGLRARMGAAGRARVERHFDLDGALRAHLDLYRRELARRGLPLPAP